MASKSNYKKTSNYLHYTLSFPIKTVNKMIKRFGKSVDIDFPTDTQDRSYQSSYKVALGITGDYIQDNWQAFMDFYGTIKNDYERMARKEYTDDVWEARPEGTVTGEDKEVNYNVLEPEDYLEDTPNPSSEI